MDVVLDVGIGLMLMYLLLSLLVTVMNELIAQFGSIRAKHLSSALRRMLNLRAKPEDADNLALYTAIMNGPTLQIAGAVAKTNWSGGDAVPSYIKRDTFLAALREAIPRLKKKDAQGKDINIGEDPAIGKDLGSLIDALPEGSQLKSALKAAVGDAAATAQEAEKRVGDWFDGMMERATGAYKRWMSTFSLLIGLVLAVAFNCDTVRVADSLAKSPALRAEVVKVAEDVTKRCTGADGKPVLPAAECQDARRNLDALQSLPIGGNRELNVSSIAGWLITGFAVSLGAPFWFDLLSKFMNVRSSFKREEEPAHA
jgi:hypothetical protein